MKTLVSLLCICLISITAYATNPTIEPEESKEIQATAQELEIQSVIQNILNDEKAPSFNITTPKCKVIIIDKNFKTIREECVEKMEDLCDHSTLVPIIYRSVFIARIHHVSYFMLQKNNL